MRFVGIDYYILYYTSIVLFKVKEHLFHIEISVNFIEKVKTIQKVGMCHYVLFGRVCDQDIFQALEFL